MAAKSPAPTKGRAAQGNMRMGKLEAVLGERLEWSSGTRSERRRELVKAVAMAVVGRVLARGGNGGGLNRWLECGEAVHVSVESSGMSRMGAVWQQGGGDMQQAEGRWRAVVRPTSA